MRPQHRPLLMSMMLGITVVGCGTEGGADPTQSEAPTATASATMSVAPTSSPATTPQVTEVQGTPTNAQPTPTATLGSIDTPTLVEDTPTETATATETTTPTVAMPDPFVTAEDQEADPADEVHIASVFSIGPGFIVIHESDDGGAPSTVIGYTEVADGDNSDVLVSLDRSAVDGEVLIAMLHVDDGIAGEYEFPDADAPAVDGNGSVVLQPFTVTVAEPVATLTVLDQTVTDPDQVSIEALTLVEDGFVAIYDDPNGGTEPEQRSSNSASVEVGNLLGYQYYIAGSYAHIDVPIDAPVGEAATYFARLHLDSDQNGVFEYPNQDPIVVDTEGEEIVSSFEAQFGGVQSFYSLNVNSVQPAEDPGLINVAEVSSSQDSLLVMFALENEEWDTSDPLGTQSLTGRGAPYTDLFISLNRATVVGEDILVTLYVDKGEAGVYEDGIDTPALDQGGSDLQAVVSIQENGDNPPDDGGGNGSDEANIIVSDQALTISTQVLIPTVVAPGESIVALYSKNGEDLDEVLGFSLVGPGESTDIYIPSSRPLTNNENLSVVLHENDGAYEDFEYPDGDPAYEVEGEWVQSNFNVTAGDEIPAVILTVRANSTDGFEWLSAEPSVHDDSLHDGLNSAIALRADWRYQIRNETSDEYPLEFVAQGDSGDEMLMSAIDDGALEGDDSIKWVEEGDSITFTVSGPFQGAISGYRAASYPDDMRGDVVFF